MHYFHHCFPQELTRNLIIFVLFKLTGNTLLSAAKAVHLDAKSKLCSQIWGRHSGLVLHHVPGWSYSFIHEEQAEEALFCSNTSKIGNRNVKFCSGILLPGINLLSSPGFQMRVQIHASILVLEPVGVRPTCDLPLTSAPFITISRDAPLPVEFLGTLLDQSRYYREYFRMVKPWPWWLRRSNEDTVNWGIPN